MAAEPLVAVRELTVTDRHAELLRDISFQVKPGECLAVVGPNGAGKTTLLRSIAGLMPRYTGSIIVRGRDVRRLSVEERARTVGLVPQRLAHIPGFTVREFLELSGLERHEASLGLVQHLEGRMLNCLSAGELQRVLIAGAVAQGAPVLLLDEPTANLDPLSRVQVEDELKTCRSVMGLSYIIVTHDISLALRAADRVIIMHAGQLRWEGSSSDSALVSRLSESYGCSFVELRHPSLSQPIVVAT